MTNDRDRLDLLYGRAAPEPSEPVTVGHTCLICGRTAGFGFGVRLRHGRPGRWSCFDHREQVERMAP